MSSIASNRELQALVAALPAVPEDGSIRAAMLEALLSRLETESPATAQVCATVLASHGDKIAHEVAETLQLRLKPFEGLQPRAAPLDEVDLIVVAVKPPELDACLAVFGVPPDERPRVLGVSGMCGWFAELSSTRILITMAGSAGNVQAAMVMAALRREVRAPVAVLVGMAAGLEGKVEIGDVVVAEHVLEYEFARLTEDGPEYQPRISDVEERLLRSVEIVDRLDPDWTGEARNVVQHASRREEHAPAESDLAGWSPRVHRGVIVAGAKLIEDGSLPKLQHDLHDRIRAAEMEGAGFAVACDEAGVAWMVIRGIADFGNPNRVKGWQFAATVAAALVLRTLITAGLVTPRQP